MQIVMSIVLGLMGSIWRDLSEYYLTWLYKLIGFVVAECLFCFRWPGKRFELARIEGCEQIHTYFKCITS